MQRRPVRRESRSPPELLLCSLRQLTALTALISVMESHEVKRVRVHLSAAGGEGAAAGVGSITLLFESVEVGWRRCSRPGGEA